MLVSKLSEIGRQFDDIREDLALVIDFLNAHDEATLRALPTDSNYVLKGDDSQGTEFKTLLNNADVFMMVQEFETVHGEERPFETHSKFYDIIYMVEGCQLVGSRWTDGMQEIAPYSEENEWTFFHEVPETGWALLNPGDLMIIPPDEVHKTRVMVGDKPCKVRTVGAKIRKK